jgi:epoxide hydrolase-like predicted phosphatase
MSAQWILLAIRAGETIMTEEDTTIHAVLWDLGGVILRTHDWSGRFRWEKRIGLSPNELEQIVFNGEMGMRATLGQADVDDVWTWVIQQLNLSEYERDSLSCDFFGSDRVDETLVEFIRNLRPKHKTGVISNAWPNTRYRIEKEWCIADAFDHIVISAEVGIAKPDPRIYQLALNGLGVASDEAVFIDDFEVNIEGALAVGMQAIQFRDSKQAISDLQKLLDLG